MKDEATVECCKCGCEGEGKLSKAKGNKKEVLAPRGWHRMEAGPYAGHWCSACWKQSFVMRSITIPVSSPTGGTWKELNAALNKCWAASTSVANWAVLELAKADTPRTPEQSRIAANPKVYLYPGAAKIAPLDVMSGASRQCLLRTVEKNYVARRYEVLWERSASLATYRYPVPFPFHNEAWACVLDPKDKRPSVTASFGGQRWILRLAGGFRNRRKIDGWKRIFGGEAIPGEMAILRKKATLSDHRGGSDSREAGGGRKTHYRVMVKLMAWFPKDDQPKEADKVLYCKSVSQSLLTYQVGSDGEPRQINADHVRRWQRQHEQRRSRLSQDMKFEKRWPARVRRRMNEHLDAACRKFQDRMDTFTHETSKIVAAFAQRQKVAKVLLDLTDHSFAPSFPWFQLTERIKYKLEDRGIGVELVTAKEGAA